MPDLKRVRLDDSGHEVTVGNVRDGMTELDKPAVDRHGRALPPKFHIDLRGAELDAALESAGLPKTGKADEKRRRLAEHRDSQTPAVLTGSDEAPTTGGTNNLRDRA